MTCRIELTARFPPRSSRCRRAVPFAGGHRDRRYSTPAGELRFAGEPMWVSDLDEKVHRRHDTDTMQVGERGSELGEYRGNPLVEFLDPFGQCRDSRLVASRSSLSRSAGASPPDATCPSASVTS